MAEAGAFVGFEENTEYFLHLFIRIRDDLPARVIRQTNGQP
jgi:hypothetical protein